MGEIIINDTWKGIDTIIINKKGKNEVKYLDENKSVYSYQIEQISKNILNGYRKVTYPGMDFEETLLNMKIIDEWLNA